MSNEWDREDNSIVAREEQIRATPSSDFTSTWQSQAEERSRLRTERRAQQGYFIPNFMDRDLLSNVFTSVADDFNGERDVYTNAHGISHTWGANKLYIVCQDCGCIGYKLTDDISELQKCTAYNCRSRNVRVIRSGEIALAVEESEFGVKMTEVYDARRERLRAARAERSTERRHPA